MKKCLLVMVAMAFFACPVALHATGCVAVTPNGSGTKTGKDWNNAMAGLPHPLVRGVTYYLADGTYPPYYEFSVPVSGTEQVVIRKAIPADHCVDAGWNASTMGSAQAILDNGTSTANCANFWIANTASTGYLTIDGQTGTGMSGNTYGIKFLGNYNNSQCKSPANVYISYGYSGRTATHIIVKYVEMVGSCGGLALNSTYYSNCHQISDTVANGGYGKDDGNIYVHNCTDCSFNHVYVHNSSSVPFFMTSGNANITFDHDYVFLNMYTLAAHSEIVDSHRGNSNVTVSYNVWEDTVGSGGAVSLGPAGTDQDWYIYGNVVWWESGNPYGFSPSAEGYGDGFVACIGTGAGSGTYCNNFHVYQNTIVNMGSINDGVTYGNYALGNAIVENNLWYSSQTSSGTNFGGLPSGSVEDYNSFLSYARSPRGGGSHDVKATGGANPFTNWISGDFTLASDNSKWSNRISLPTGNWNTDAAGNPFTTDRGAYQYAGAVAKPDPPSSLAVTGVS